MKKIWFFFCLLATGFFMSACTGQILAGEGRSVQVEIYPDRITGDHPPSVFGYGGNIWLIPDAFELGISDRILRMERPGIARIGLGDEILSRAHNIEDLRRRLNDYRLNGFLRKFKQAGGEVMVILDTVPFWVSSNKSREKHGHLEIFRLSPPANSKSWQEVVSAVVKHFNGALGLDAYYEVWNEPDVDFLGSDQDYMNLYYNTVVGARTADRHARVGGSGISDITSTSTAGSRPAKGEVRPLFLGKLLDYARKTPVKELGLKRLPVDFVSWHGYYIDPPEYYRMIVPLLRAQLEATGYPRNTPLIDTEWNVAAIPPYPEGDLNANEVGAAFAASTLISMAEAGVDGQVFQMFVDPGIEGYSGGTFSKLGLPRATFNAFSLFSKLKGRQVETNANDPWVQSVAFDDGKKLYILVVNRVPTLRMINKTLGMKIALEDRKLLKAVSETVSQKDLDAYNRKGVALPGQYGRQLQGLLDNNKQQLALTKNKAADWNKGISLDIKIAGKHFRSVRTTRYLIDSAHSNPVRDLKKINRAIATENRHLSTTWQRTLSETGLDAYGKSLFAELKVKKGYRNTLQKVSPEKRKKASKVFANIMEQYLGAVRSMVSKHIEWPSATLYSEKITWPDSGRLSLRSEPNAVQLFVLEYR